MRILLIWGSIFYLIEMSGLVYLSLFPSWKGLGGNWAKNHYSSLSDKNKSEL